MTRMERRERAIRRNPNDVRFDDLDLLLRAYGFTRRNRGKSHHVYRHPSITEHVNVPVHGSTVKPIYVKQALAAIDAIKATQQEQDA